MEELALQRVLEDEEVAKALVACPMVALEVGLADVFVESLILRHVEEALSRPNAMLHIGADLVQNHSQPRVGGQTRCHPRGPKESPPPGAPRGYQTHQASSARPC